MNKVLLINACVRPESRTLELAKLVLDNVGGSVEEVKLADIPLSPLDLAAMQKRDHAGCTKDFSDPVFDLAKQFAAADSIVVAAPYWDLMFPAVLKTYMENITVCGVTFRYSEHGRPCTMCKAKSLYYITTAGGFIGGNDFGFAYMEAVAKNFFGISEIHRFSAEGLDITGADVCDIMQKAKENILAELTQ